MSVTADLMDVRIVDTLHDYGDQALLLEFDGTAEVLAWTSALREAELLGVLDIVPASRTVLLKLAGPRHQAPTRQRLGKLRVTAEALSEASAPDRRPGRHRDRRGVRRRRPRRGGPAHRPDARPGGGGAHRHPVAGRIRWFRTGFRLPGRWRRNGLTCRGSPSRGPGCPRVRWRWPASSAASTHGNHPVAGSSSAASQDAAVWDVDRDPPALLRPGMWVQFRAVSEGVRS